MAYKYLNLNPEQQARLRIDKMLDEAGWVIQNNGKHNVAAAVGVAIREYPTDAGPADYVLFVDRKPVGVIEAKREEEGLHLTIVEDQAAAYAQAKLKRLDNDRLPFVYESTGELSTFTDYRDPKPRSRRVFSFHRPETLGKWLKEEKTLRARLHDIPALSPERLRDCQVQAITNLEASFRDARLKALVQMATGSGKTFTAITSIYRLLKFAKVKRVLFLVDTKNLGEQAEQEFRLYQPQDDNRLFTELYGVTRLTSSFIPGDSQVYISTIQRLYAILKGEELDERDEEESPESKGWGTSAPLRKGTSAPVSKGASAPVSKGASAPLSDRGEAPLSDRALRLRSATEGKLGSATGDEPLSDRREPSLRDWRGPMPVVYNERVPPDFFDFIVIDECHRSIYNLWKQVLDYFDAFQIGLTATPDNRTFGYFDQNLVCDYGYKRAVEDGVLVPYNVFEIGTKVTREGGLLQMNERVDTRNKLTRKEFWMQLDEDLAYTAKQLDDKVVNPSTIRLIAKTVKEHLPQMFPDRYSATAGASAPLSTGASAPLSDRGEAPLSDRGDGTLSDQALRLRSATEGNLRSATEGNLRSATEGNLRSATGDGTPGGRDGVAFEVPKMLIFAKSDSHADDIIRIFREEFGEENKFCKKITYKSEEDPKSVLQQFRNEYYPRIAVTVDMIATGTDIRPLEVLLFMRDVKSRSYYEQMKGRGTRTCSLEELRATGTPAAKFTKDHFVIIDAIGVEQSRKTDSRPLERKPGMSLKEVLERVHLGATDEDMLTTLANRLIMLDKRMDDRERAGFTNKTGLTIPQVVKRLLDAHDPDTLEVLSQQSAVGSHSLEEQEAAFKDAHEAVIRAATAPFDDYTVREYLVEVKRMQDQIIDHVNRDELVSVGWVKNTEEAAHALVDEFRQWIEAHKEEITALQIFYSQPFNRRTLTLKMIRETAEAIKRNKPGLAPLAVWQAYEKLEKVSGQPRNELTALVSLLRRATERDTVLTAWDKSVDKAFQEWTFKQQAGALKYTEEQMAWLRMMKDFVAASFHIEREDFELPPFNKEGRLGRMWQLFGERTDAIIDELNEVLAA